MLSCPDSIWFVSEAQDQIAPPLLYQIGYLLYKFVAGIQAENYHEPLDFW